MAFTVGRPVPLPGILINDIVIARAAPILTAAAGGAASFLKGLAASCLNVVDCNVDRCAKSFAAARRRSWQLPTAGGGVNMALCLCVQRRGCTLT
jgi:hypothetical protein